MARTTHLNSLQALEMALREGSLQAAAKRLGITPAAVGQRIRALEQFLDTDLITRGRSGLYPTPALEGALDDLQIAFAALDRVTTNLDVQRRAEVHILSDPDWTELWLMPRIGRFREEHPNILFNINGEGDVPIRLGAPDIYIDRDPEGKAASGDVLYTEYFLPVGSQENAARISDPFTTKAADSSPQYLPVGMLSDEDQMWRHSKKGSLEGFPLLHTQDRPGRTDAPGWQEWLQAFPYERTAPERGVRYPNFCNALDGVKSDVGLLICGLSCILDGLDEGTLRLPFPASEHLVSDHPYCLRVRSEGRVRAQMSRFLDWLRSEAALTRVRMDALIAG